MLRQPCQILANKANLANRFIYKTRLTSQNLGSLSSFKSICRNFAVSKIYEHKEVEFGSKARESIFEGATLIKKSASTTLGQKVTKKSPNKALFVK